MITNPHAKVIVCYGDSNTWGDVPNENRRYAPNIRWTGILQNILGDDYEVVNEGLCGRTFKAIEPNKEHRAGLVHLRSILQTNEPTDLIAIMLGTNDVKTTFDLSADECAKKAVDLGDDTARWLYAATLDRYLLSIDKPQKFGTQFKNTLEGNPELGPVDPNTSDEERAEYHVPPLKDAVKKYKEKYGLS